MYGYQLNLTNRVYMFFVIGKTFAISIVILRGQNNFHFFEVQLEGVLTWLVFAIGLYKSHVNLNI